MNFKMNMITSTLLAAGFSLLAGSAAAQTCVANNCAALGFTKAADVLLTKPVQTVAA